MFMVIPVCTALFTVRYYRSVSQLVRHWGQWWLLKCVLCKLYGRTVGSDGPGPAWEIQTPAPPSPRPADTNQHHSNQQKLSTPPTTHHWYQFYQSRAGWNWSETQIRCHFSVGREQMWPRINIDKLRDKFYLFTPTQITNRRMEIITDWRDDEFYWGSLAQ